MKLKSCNLCGSEKLRRTSNAEVYGKVYGNGKCIICDGCGGYVGCHDSGRSLGLIANKEMRRLKSKCHAMFDPIWKSRKVSRSHAYVLLAQKLDIEVKDCHFGHFDIDMLNKSISVLSSADWFLK